MLPPPAASVLDLIGNTPMVRLDRLGAGLSVPLLGKCEFLEPGGSVKDRIALAIVNDAEQRGQLRPGMTLVEATAGNTGVGLALVAAVRGYRLVCVMPEKMSADKRVGLAALGAEVVITANAPPHDPRNFRQVAARLAGENGWFPTDQFAHPANPRVHEETTGPEVLAQCGGRVGAFVCGVGTGGTITGVGRCLKGRGPGVKVVLADPVGSRLAHLVDPRHPDADAGYQVEGIGGSEPPAVLDLSVIDAAEVVSDVESFAMAGRLMREEGLLVGGSCGMAVQAALRVAERLTKDDVLVVLLPDGGRGYLGKIFNDKWMADYGFLEVASGETVGDLLHDKSGQTPTLVHTHPNETVRDAIDILREYGVSQLPVVRAEPPVTAGEVVGAVDEKTLLDALFAGRASLADRVERHMSPPLPIIGSGEPVSAAVAALGSADALVVHVDGKPAGVVTRQDVLGHLVGAGPTVAS